MCPQYLSFTSYSIDKKAKTFLPSRNYAGHRSKPLTMSPIHYASLRRI